MYEHILNGREKRYNLELQLLERFKKPILVVTVNYPGSSKTDKTERYIFNEAIKTIMNINFMYFISGKNAAGHYFMGVTQEIPFELKEKSVNIEDNHPLGRLFDLDIIDYPYKKINRKELYRNERKCIVCGQDARDCILTGKHNISEVMEKIDRIVEEYKCSID